MRVFSEHKLPERFSTATPAQVSNGSRRGAIWSTDMKKIITIVAALSTIGLATPALAQGRYGNDNAYGYANGNGGIEARTEQLQRRFQLGIQRGTISRQEAGYLSDGFRQLSRLERQYSRGGFNRNERQDLQLRIQQLQQQIQIAERSRGGRFDRDDHRDNRDWNDGRGDGDGRYDDRNGDDRRWDDNRRDRD
jgi:hypothetical protein